LIIISWSPRHKNFPEAFFLSFTEVSYTIALTTLLGLILNGYIGVSCNVFLPWFMGCLMHNSGESNIGLLQKRRKRIFRRLEGSELRTTQ